MILLFLVFAVYDRLLLSSAKPAGTDLTTWVKTAPAWAGYGGEVENGVLIHPYGPYDTGKLTLRYNPTSDRLTVAGSLQTFRYGHNSGPFPFAEAYATCAALATALQVPPESIRLHLLETGVTVPLSAPPTAFLSQLATGKYGPLQVPFYAKQPPAGVSAPLLYTANFEQYRVKVYDAGKWNQLKKPHAPPGPALRIEIHYRKAKKVAAVLGWNGNLTLANLMQPDVFTCLSNALLASWRRIQLPVTTMPEELTSAERQLLFAGTNDSDFWNHLKRTASRSTYFRTKSQFRKLLAGAAPNSLPYTAEMEGVVRAGLPD